MSTFKFNFNGKEDKIVSTEEPHTKEEVQWLESFELLPSTIQIKELDLIVKNAKMFVCGDIEIGHVVNFETISKIEDNEFTNVVKQAESEHSDLLIGKYEGGLKIWECTSDLINYFEENKDNINFMNKNTLDLGCGAGILGIYAFLNKSNVTFQDYNKEVIEHSTIPNVLLNIDEDDKEAEIKRCKFYSGDWGSFNNKCKEKFDIIITSETIYNECNYGKLLNVFLDRLHENGVVYIAAKTYYFGVGGGIRQFEELVKNNGTFCIEACWKSTGGIQREIIKIRRKLCVENI